jgi:protein-L-isoaspartate(D-aspartate) O-methyltransferase
MKNQYLQQRAEMVAVQLKARNIHDPRVLKAMNTVPRHFFVPDTYQEQAHEDHPLPIGYSQTISQPYIVALMLEVAELKASDIVLEIGTGSGYNAAILSQLVQKVYSIENIPELAHQAKKNIMQTGYSNITLITGDGSIGLEEHAPFDVILVTAGSPKIPSILKEQLAIGGRLIIPVGNHVDQKLIKITRISSAAYQKEILSSVAFVPLRGREGWH